MNSTYMKVCLLHKLRFVQRFPYLASEVGLFNSDVAGIAKNRLHEFEIKTSLADFKNDFKKPKHQLFKTTPDPEDRYGLWVPHFFSFAVTEEIANEVAAKLIDYPKYGLIVIKPVETSFLMRAAPVQLKRAKQLHGREISQDVYQQFLYRMGSELASNATLKLRKETAIKNL